MRRREHGENWREVDVAKEEVERKEAQGYQILWRGLWLVKYELFCIHNANPMYLKWTPTSDEFENVIEVFYDFTLVRLHGSPASPSLLLSSLRITECESTTKCSLRSGVNPSQACLSVRIPEERISLGLGAF